MSEGIGRIVNAWPQIWTAELAFVAFENAHRTSYAANRAGDADLAAVCLMDLKQRAQDVVDVLGMLRSFLDSRALRAESDFTWN